VEEIRAAGAYLLWVLGIGFAAGGNQGAEDPRELFERGSGSRFGAALGGKPVQGEDSCTENPHTGGAISGSWVGRRRMTVDGNGGERDQDCGGGRTERRRRWEECEP
jgi:hypothetical protein